MVLANADSATAGPALNRRDDGAEQHDLEGGFGGPVLVWRVTQTLDVSGSLPTCRASPDS
jgi:hypothetical protein